MPLTPVSLSWNKASRVSAEEHSSPPGSEQEAPSLDIHQLRFCRVQLERVPTERHQYHVAQKSLLLEPSFGFSRRKRCILGYPIAEYLSRRGDTKSRAYI